MVSVVVWGPLAIRKRSSTGRRATSEIDVGCCAAGHMALQSRAFEQRLGKLFDVVRTQKAGWDLGQGHRIKNLTAIRGMAFPDNV